MKKIFTLLSLLATFTSFAQVRISQVYGGGGNSGATYNQDFVEIFNAGTASVAIGGWSVQYSSAAGTAWAVAAIPASTNIGAGKYYLVALATAAVGISLPTPDVAVTTVNLSGTTGKVALVNNSTALVGATGCGGATVIDALGYGAGNCFEGAVFPATGITTAQCMKRTNECADANNNSTDFSLVSLSISVPRNSATVASLCTSPTITAATNIANMTTTLGTPSVSQFYTLSGSNLSPAAGNLTVTPTAGLEISFNNTTFFSTAQTVAYTAGALASTPIYVRIAATASQGALAGASVTNSGGSATASVITVAGSVNKNYYSNAAGNLNVASTWGDNTAGTMNPPADFTVPYAIFNIVNRTTTVLGGPIDVSGVGSKIILGDGVTNITLSTTPTDSIKANNTIDVLTNAILQVGNKVAPVFGILATNSVVDYSFSGVTTSDTVKINIANYFTLKLTNGLKYLKPGITTVNGDLNLDGTINMNGAGSPFSTVVLKGGLNMVNNAMMEDSTTGFANRFTLNMAGIGLQKIRTSNSELRIFRLQRDTIIGIGDVNIDLGVGDKIAIGNTSGGDLKLTQKISGTPTNTTFSMDTDAQIAIVRNGSIFTDVNGKAGVISSNNSKIIINKSTTSTTINPGTLRFTPTSTLKDFTVNITTPTKDSIIIADNILINNSLNLTKGVVVMAAGQTLELANSATITGGSAASYVDGNVKSTLSAGETFLFPVGQAKRYSPVEITTAVANDFTVKYNKQAYATTTINAATTALIPTYHISGSEHWIISQGTVNNADVKFYYNNPLSGVINPVVASIAHFNGTDWDDIGRTTNGTDANGTYISKSGINNFSPFTFGGADGILPIVLENFIGTLNNNTATLSWRTACEDAGDAFELEYSTNGITFSNIYNTNAFGNCNGNVYKYIHNNAIAATNYYRLKMINANGRITFSNIVILKNGKNNFETKIVSTNNNALLGLSITAPTAGKGNVHIVNAQGQKIYNQTIAYNNGNQINYINTALWSNGIYFVNFTNENGNKTTVTYVK
jgi:hypothetical protein